MNFTDGKQICIQCVNHKTDAENSLHTQKNEKWQRQEDGLKTEETIAESGRIFFRNLPYTVSEEEIQTLFEKYGKFLCRTILNQISYQKKKNLTRTICLL